MAGASIVDPCLHKQMAALEDHIAIQKRDLQTLLVDNQRLAFSHVAVLSAARHDLQRLSDSAAIARANRDADLRELFDRSARAEDEVRRVETMREELLEVRSDLVKLAKDRDGLLKKLRAEEMGKGKGRGEEEEQRWIWLRRRLLFPGERSKGEGAAVEYEKRANAENLEQSKEMEKNLVFMARKIGGSSYAEPYGSHY